MQDYVVRVCVYQLLLFSVQQVLWAAVTNRAKTILYCQILHIQPDLYIYRILGICTLCNTAIMHTHITRVSTKLLRILFNDDKNNLFGIPVAVLAVTSKHF